MRVRLTLILALLLGLSAILCLVFASGTYVAVRLLTDRAAVHSSPQEALNAPERLPVETPPARASVPAEAAPRALNRLVILGSDGNIYTSRPDGNDRQALTRDAAENHIYRQPAWSPTGERVAWAEMVTQGSELRSALLTSRLDGSDPTRTDTAEYAPFYLFWSPDGQRVAFLSNWSRGLALRLANLVEEGSDLTMLGQGRSLYFSWAPDSRRLLAHRDAGRLSVLSLGDGEQTLPVEPASFGAPQWSAGNDPLLFAVSDGSGGRLVVADVTGQEQRDVARFAGAISFSLSPDGRQVAYVVTTVDIGAAAFGRLYVADLETGQTQTVSTDPTLAFFWSPDSRMLAYVQLGDSPLDAPRAALGPGSGAADNEPWLRWHAWDGTGSIAFGQFLPSPTYLLDYLRYFDQYARSMTPWAPDGGAFTYAGEDMNGAQGVWVQPASPDGAAVRIGDGVYAAWSPR